MHNPDPPVPWRALLALAAGATCISFSAVLVRLSETGSTTQGFYRVLIGGLVLLAGAATVNRGGFRDLSRERIAWIAVAGMFFALDLFVWHRSIHLVGPGLATLLGNFQVFVVAALAAIFLRERVGPELMLAIPVAFVGLALVVGPDAVQKSESTRAGVFYGLMTALFYGAYILSLQKARRLARRAQTVTDLGLASGVSGAFLGSIALATGEDLIVTQPIEWSYLVAYALVAQVIGWGLIAFSLPHLRASIVGLVLLLQPILSFVWDVLFFSRPFGGREATGAALALSAIYLGSRARAPRNRS